MIDLLYFASLRETLNTEKEQLDLPLSINRVADLKKWLAARGSDWASAFSRDSNILVSVNQKMASDDSMIRDGDEIGFFPPVTGG